MPIARPCSVEGNLVIEALGLDRPFNGKSMYNGFQHDLKQACDLVHAHGAYVYADLIQGVALA